MRAYNIKIGQEIKRDKETQQRRYFGKRCFFSLLSKLEKQTDEKASTKEKS